ncbi:MAG: hypothetical protein ACKVU4_15430 [Phycisphaerales bacterium]
MPSRAWLLAPFVLAPGCAPEARPPVDPPTPSRPVPAVSLSLGPISFFEDRCARCHGAYGSMYGPALAHLADAALVRAVDDMVIGPAASELNAPDLAALVAFHRSLAGSAPFVAVTASGPGTLAGEVTPGASVTVERGGTARPATVEGHRWRLDGAPDDADPFIITARIGAHATTLTFPRETHSHARPGPDR